MSNTLKLTAPLLAVGLLMGVCVAVNHGRRAPIPATIAQSVARGDVVSLQSLLGSDTRDGEVQAQSAPLLLMAVTAQRVDMVRLLLKHGANPNASAQGGVTPLAAAQGWVRSLDLGPRLHEPYLAKMARLTHLMTALKIQRMLEAFRRVRR